MKRAAVVTVVLVVACALASCSSGPVAEAFPAGPGRSPSAAAGEPTRSAPEPAPTVTITGRPIPSACGEIVGPQMRAALETGLGPSNAPGFELLSTDNVEGLEVIEGATTLRCTWGTPGQDGASTNVTSVTAAESAGLIDAYAAAGYGCEPAMEGTLCRIERSSVTLDDDVVVHGESQFFRGDRWVSTAWVGTLPRGYVEDVVANLWDAGQRVA